MTENVESVTIEHLHHIRGRADLIAEDMSDIRHRMSSLESAMVLVTREVSAGDETDARPQVTTDRPLDRIERIGRRLEPTDN